jgi:hypothetical protein
MPAGWAELPFMSGSARADGKQKLRSEMLKKPFH